MSPTPPWLPWLFGPGPSSSSPILSPRGTVPGTARGLWDLAVARVSAQMPSVLCHSLNISVQTWTVRGNTSDSRRPLPSPQPAVPVTRASVISPRIVMAWSGGGQAPGSSGNKEGQGPSHLRRRLGAVSCLLLSPLPAPAVPPFLSRPGGETTGPGYSPCSHSTPASKALEHSLGLEGPDLS